MDEAKNPSSGKANDFIFEMDSASEETQEDFEVPFADFNQAVIWTADWTTETIAEQMRKGNIDLNPSFQRRDAWSDHDKSALIESLILGIPVPPIVLAEEKDRKGHFIVLDGKQRLLSIRRFYAEEDDEFEPLYLSRLQLLQSCDGMNYSKMSQDFHDLSTALDNQSVRTVVIKNWPSNDFLYTVFLRLNNGSKKLSPQELRQALNPGKFIDYVDEFTSSSTVIHEMMGNKGPDKRMRDSEIVLRYFAFKFYPEGYSGSLKSFLDESCSNFNRKWDDDEIAIRECGVNLEKAVAFLLAYPEQKPFSSKAGGRFNRSVFEVLAYYLSREDVLAMIKENPDAFFEQLDELKDNEDFIEATSSTTKTVKRVCSRFSLMASMVLKIAASLKTRLEVPFFEFDEERNRIRLEVRDSSSE